MKKLLALALILIMCMGSLAACGTTEQPAEPTTAPTQAPTTAPTQAPVEETVSDLVNAKNYLFTMYKDQTVSTPVDYTVVGVVNIGGVLFPIEWTTDNDTVKIIPGDDKMVTIDVDDKNPEEVTYVLTATLKDDKGNTESCSFTHKVPAGLVITAAELFDAAKVVDIATNMADEATFAAVLKGTVTEIKDAYSEKYGNISLYINVAGTDKTFYCFRLTGEGAATLAVGDEIAVVGTISKYKGAPQFGAGCLLIPVEEFESVQAAVAGYAIVGNEVVENKTITGVVTEVNTAYNEEYGNVTVTIVAAGQEAYKIECYRMKGDIAATVKVGDTITVTGNLKNYKGKIEFDAGCIGVLVAAAEAPVAEDLVINFADLIAGGYGYEAALNGDAVDVTIASQYQEIQYILPEAVELAAYTTLIVDVTSNAQLDIKLVNSDAVLNEYSQKTPFRDNYTAEGQAITEPVYIDLAEYADKDLSQINFMAMGNDTAFTIKSITFVK